MLDLPYSLVIEATEDPAFFAFYSPDLEGFTGVGRSVEDCIDQAREATKGHVELLRQQQLPVPPVNPDPVVTIRNEQSPVG
jgi:predicted RNase H-like HicB family nuclease